MFCFILYLFQILKDELENQQHLVLTCLDQMRQLAQRGLEVLDKEEINTLQKNLISLKRQYDCLMNESDRLLRRLTTALEELQKFKVLYIFLIYLSYVI